MSPDDHDPVNIVGLGYSGTVNGVGFEDAERFDTAQDQSKIGLQRAFSCISIDIANTHFSACHAVMNAIVSAGRHQLQKYSIYSVHSPCKACQRMLTMSGMSLDRKNSACKCNCFER